MSYKPGAMAKREDWALPAAYESAMDGLEEQIRQGGTLDRPGKRRLGKRVLILAAIVASREQLFQHIQRCQHRKIRQMQTIVIIHNMTSTLTGMISKLLGCYG